MRAAATAFLKGLDAEAKKAALQPFDESRKEWHFTPREAKGLELKAMTEAQRALARALLRSALSSQGVLKVETIMSLDKVLHDLESTPEREASWRDPLKYRFSIYGDPEGEKPWAFKVEGHHVVFVFTLEKSKVLGVTPAFLGANPAEVRGGTAAGLKTLAREEELGRALRKSLDAEQRKIAVLAETAPADVFLLPGVAFEKLEVVGLEVAKMNAEQRLLVEALLEEFAHNLRRDLARVELERIREKGVEKIRFAWAGGAEPGVGHYYRLHGPTFAIEYDNTQNGANHVHTLWRDAERDFGGDPLRDHLEHDHKR